MPRRPLLLTRRNLAAVLPAATAAATASAAQAPPTQTADTPADLLTQARQGVERTRETLSKYKIPMAVEPATRFEA